MGVGDDFRVVARVDAAAQPADDARKVLLNAALAVADERAVAAAVMLLQDDDEEVRDGIRPLLRDVCAAVVATTDPCAVGVMTEVWHREGAPYSSHEAKVCVRIAVARDHPS